MKKAIIFLSIINLFFLNSCTDDSSDNQNENKISCKIGCDGNRLTACPNGSYGVPEYHDCEHGCKNNQCLSETCTPGESACKDETTLIVCDESTKQYIEKNCTFGCIDRQCRFYPPAQACQSDTCKDASTLFVCDVATKKYIEKPCEHGCENNACKTETCETDLCLDSSTLLACDESTKQYIEKPCEHGCENNACNEPKDGTRIRLMAANITTGKNQTYDDMHGRNIFKAVKPDIVMIQEFNLSSQSYEDFVHEIFGEEYTYYRGTAAPGFAKEGIPNGIISRYPIIDSGQWKVIYQKANGETKDGYQDRMYVWSVIDIPGERDLLAVSVHLHTSNNIQEYLPLTEKIASKQQEGSYYVALGGDFNSKDTYINYIVDPAKESAKRMQEVFYINRTQYPIDQKGNANTSAKRNTHLDWLLLSHDLQAYEIPTEIGFHVGDNAYTHGHVFDSRVYAETTQNGVNELLRVEPVQANDSGATNMQHMAIIRDILIPEKD